MNGNETGTIEYLTELAFYSNLPNLIVLNVAFYMHLIRQFDTRHVLVWVYHGVFKLTTAVTIPEIQLKTRRANTVQTLCKPGHCGNTPRALLKSADLYILISCAHAEDVRERFVTGKKRLRCGIAEND